MLKFRPVRHNNPVGAVSGSFLYRRIYTAADYNGHKGASLGLGQPSSGA